MMRPGSPPLRTSSRSRLETVSTAALRLKTPVYVSHNAVNDEEALQLFKEWLQAPRVKQYTEDELVQNCEQKFVTDPTFDTSYLYSVNVSTEAKEALGPVLWRRVTGKLCIPSKHHCTLVEGCIAGNRWFLGALAAVACKQELLLDLVVSDEQSARGVYTFRFFKHGRWCPVVVDNRLPCMELQQRLAFCSSGQAQELWPSLVEKAYARLHGGYTAITSGSVADALVDLTGGVLVNKVNLSCGDQMADAAEGALWSKIVDWLSSGSLIVCMMKQPSHSSSHAESQPAHGVTANSPYSILSAKVLQSGTKLLQLHCPWSPEGMWQGPWAAGSAEWDTQEGQAATADDAALAAGLENPTTFWCSYWDFIQVFNRCWVVQVFPESWQQLHVAAGWAGATAGGPPTAASAEDISSAHTGCRTVITHKASAIQQTDAVSGTGAVGVADCHGGISGHVLKQVKMSQHVHQVGQLQHHQQQQHQQRLAGARQLLVRSSWCCNPQFRLTASGTGEVVVCLGQQDSQLVNKKYQPKKQREFQIGLTVLKPICSSHASFSSYRPTTTTLQRRSRSASPVSGHDPSTRSKHKKPTVTAGSQLGRVWDPRQCTLIADTGLTSSREVVVRFRAQQGQTYMLVPYARQAGDTGPFTLRAYAAHTMQLEQLPSPLSLVIGGQWSGHMAGGRSCHCQSWGSNPQYLISCQRATTAVIALVRPDICNSLLPAPFEPSQCIGVTVCSPGVSIGGLGRRAAVLDAAAEVYAESDYAAMDEVVLLMQLQPEVPYLVVPSTATPGLEAPFELRLLSSHPLELVPLPEVHTICHKGTWEAGSAGGCNIHPTWTDNPAFPLKLEKRSLCKITLQRLQGSWSRNKPLGEMLGFYILRQTAASATGQRQRSAAAAAKQVQLYESVFVPVESCEAEVELPAGLPLLLVPCTYAPGVHGSFAVTVTAATNAGLTFEAVSGDFAAAVALAQ